MKTLASLMILFALTATAEARTVTVTGQNGGTATSQRACALSGGQWTCTAHTVLTGPKGATGTRDRVTDFGADGATSTVTGTRANGHSFTRVVTVKR